MAHYSRKKVLFRSLYLKHKIYKTIYIIQSLLKLILCKDKCRIALFDGLTTVE